MREREEKGVHSDVIIDILPTADLRILSNNLGLTEVWPMTLKKELKHFEAIKGELLAHNKDQFAVIKGDTLVGTYTTPGEAFEEGVRRFGNTSFLIQQVREEAEIVQMPALAVGAINADV